MNRLSILVKYLDKDCPRLYMTSIGDCIDLYAAEDVSIPLGESKLINLGVAMQLPQNYEAHIYPRSSTFKNWGIVMANHVGIVDNTYCGDNDWWMFNAICVKGIQAIDDKGTMGTIIHKGDKIAQFRIYLNMPKVNIIEVDSLHNKDRGGIGSTGMR